MGQQRFKLWEQGAGPGTPQADAEVLCLKAGAGHGGDTENKINGNSYFHPWGGFGGTHWNAVLPGVPVGRGSSGGRWFHP